MKVPSVSITVLALFTVAASLAGCGQGVSDDAAAQDNAPGAPTPYAGSQQGMNSPGAAPHGGNGIVTVKSSRSGTSVTLGGTVVPYKEVTLTAQVPGRVEYLAGTEGDSFKEQTVLVTISDQDLMAMRRAAVAALANAEATFRNAQVQYSREYISPQTQSLTRAPGMGMPSMFDQMFTQPFSSMMPGSTGGSPYIDRSADIYSAGTQISQAQGNLLAARSRLDEIDAKLRDTKSIAPFSGVITKKLVEIGDTVQPGQPMLVFADTHYLQVKVDVPARLMGSLRMGQMVPARLDVGDTRVQARVAQIFPTADEQRHTVIVKFDLPEGVPGGPGMYAEVMLSDPNTPVTTVPVIPDSAVVWRGSLPAVFVMTNDNRTQLRLIRLGDYVGPGTVGVLSGLQVGERILANPPAGMASGWEASRGGGER